MADFQDRNGFRRPEIMVEEFLRRGVQGLYRSKEDGVPIIFRALVLAVDPDGGLLENPSGTGSVTHNINGHEFSVPAKVGPKNPPNSLKARVLTDGADKFRRDEDLRVFWPFFPENVSLPVKPGEHVYVLFEDTESQHGLWVTKIPGHVGSNYAPGASFYQPEQRQPLMNRFDDGKDAGKGKTPTDQDASEMKPGNRLMSLYGR